MKEIKLIFFLLLSVTAFGQNKQVAEPESQFPVDMECVPQPFYLRRTDKKPGREITINLKDKNNVEYEPSYKITFKKIN